MRSKAPWTAFEFPSKTDRIEFPAEVAQLVEQWSEEPCVAGPIPALGTEPLRLRFRAIRVFAPGRVELARLLIKRLTEDANHTVSMSLTDLQKAASSRRTMSLSMESARVARRVVVASRAAP